MIKYRGEKGGEIYGKIIYKKIRLALRTWRGSCLHCLHVVWKISYRQSS